MPPVTPLTMVVGIHSAVERTSNRHAERIRGIRSGKSGTFRGEPVHVWSSDMPMSGAGQAVGPVLICHQDKYIWCIHLHVLVV